MTTEIRKEVYEKMDHVAAADYLMAEEGSDEFFEQLFILERMGKDEEF